MKRVVIWGIGNDYEKIVNQIKYEELKGNIQVEALVSRRDLNWCDHRDGYLLISKEELCGKEYDFLIIASSKFYSDIKKEAIELNIPEHKIIDGSIFNMPLFDFKRYMSLLDDPVTIWSDDCWGGYVYHSLKLPFTSPCINIWWPRDSYMKFIQNPIYYIEQPLEVLDVGDLRKNSVPKGKIGIGDEQIQMEFLHAPTFEKAREQWDKRKKRINKNRMFFKLGLPANNKCCEQYLRIFDKIPFPKICFYSGHTEKKDVVYLKRFEWYAYQWEYAEDLDFTTYTRKLEKLYKDIDILKLLNGEDYIRESS